MRPTRTGCGRPVTAPSSRIATTKNRLVALTAGEPAGIGPDLCALLARDAFPGRLVVIGDPEVIAARARARGLDFKAPPYRGPDTAPALSLLAMPAAAAVRAGKLDPANGRHVV